MHHVDHAIYYDEGSRPPNASAAGTQNKPHTTVNEPESSADTRISVGGSGKTKGCLCLLPWSHKIFPATVCFAVETQTEYLCSIETNWVIKVMISASQSKQQNPITTK